jgi:diaminopimelate dehydrogenase
MYMDKKIKVAVMGCGHIGSYAVQGIMLTGDMRLVGILDLCTEVEKIKAKYPGVEVADEVSELSEKPDVILMACPTRVVPKVAPTYLKMGISTVDCFDMHGQSFMELKGLLDPIAKENGAVAVMGSGVDPGACTMIRALFEMWAPTGMTYVNYGPGMSMGHTVAVKTFKGVKDAYSITRPGRPGAHQRDVYIVTEPGVDFADLTAQIMKDSYFSHDDVHFFQVDDVEPMIDLGHRIRVSRKGGASGIDNQILEFDSIFHNPASTAQVAISSVRAATRLEPGAHIMLEIPLIHFLPYTVDQVITRLV